MQRALARPPIDADELRVAAWRYDAARVFKNLMISSVFKISPPCSAAWRYSYIAYLMVPFFIWHACRRDQCMRTRALVHAYVIYITDSASYSYI